MRHGHSPEEIKHRLNQGPSSNFLRDFVYGAIDGVVTTFAIVTGAIGATMSTKVIVVLGIANVLADGFSMAVGNYLGIKSEQENAHRLREVEKRHIHEIPEGEREEVRQILFAKGLKGDTLEAAVKAITSNEEQWIEFMMSEEYGVSKIIAKPVRAALVTFFAFLCFGLVPLSPFVIGLKNPLALSIGATGIVFFLIGAIRSRWSSSPWWRNGIETLIIGALAAFISYAAGTMFADFF